MFLKKYFSPIYSSISAVFNHSFKTTFSKLLPEIPKNEKNMIISLSVFLMITYSFMFKKKEKNFNFEWQSPVTQIFKKKDKKNFLICSIRYLFDLKHIFFDETIMKNNFSEEWKENFLQQYTHSIIEKRTLELNENIKAEKYSNLLDVVSTINHIYFNEIPKDSSKVIDLVKFTASLKNKTFELFGHKAEYILFLFWVNLGKQRES